MTLALTLTAIIPALILVVVFCLIYWAVHRITSAAGIPDFPVAVIDIVLVIVFLILLLRLLGVDVLGRL